MRVRLTERAEADLEELADFIADRDPLRALHVVLDLRSACEDLASYPLRYPLAVRYARLGVRRRVRGRFLIFYTVSAEQIDVLRIVHGATDYEDSLLDEPE